MSHSYKIKPTFSSNAGVLKRWQNNQYRVAYYFDTTNDLYKLFQRKLYKLGYDVEINGIFDRKTYFKVFQEYSANNTRINYDYDGICYHTLYNLLFNLQDKIEKETEFFNLERSEVNYNFIKHRSDFYSEINEKFLIFLNPMDEFGEFIINKLYFALNYYQINYLDVKQTNFKESMYDRLDRIRNYCNRRAGINPLIVNIGNAIDYSVPKDTTTLLRGINIYSNKGMVLGDTRKTFTFQKYLSKKLNTYFYDTFEYIRMEENTKLPILSTLSDLATFQIEFGYKNNPIDLVLLNNKKLIGLFINAMCFALQRVTSFSEAKRYIELEY